LPQQLAAVKKNPPIRSLRKDLVHGSFECSPTPVPHDRLRLPPPSSFGLALHRRSPPSKSWVSLAALPAGVAGSTRPRRLASSRTGRRRRPSTPPLAAEARLPARALLLLALPRPDSCRSSPPAVLARRSPSIPADVAPRHALPPKEARRPPLPVRGHVRDAPLPAAHGTRHLRAQAGRRSPVAPPSPAAHGPASPLHAHRAPVVSRTPAAAAEAIAAMPHLNGETD